MSTSKEPRSMRPWFQNPSLSALRQEMNDLFENFFGEASGQRDSSPKVDVCETPDAVEVTTDVPGYKPEEIDIEVADNYLTITGTHAEEVRNEGERKMHRLERRTGSFTRSVWLPCPVSEENVDAHLSEGVLYIRLPKAETAKRRKIEVRSGPSITQP